MPTNLSEPTLNREAFYKKIGLDKIQMRKSIVKNMDKPLGSVLELGTGNGLLTKFLAMASTQVTSVDIDLVGQTCALEELTQANLQNNVSLLLGNAEKLSFPDKSFDTVVCAYAFHHFKRPLLVVDEMLRIFKKQFILVEFNKAGFAAVGKAHELDGNKHEQNNIPFLKAQEYILKNNFKLKELHENWHDIYMVTRG